MCCRGASSACPGNSGRWSRKAAEISSSKTNGAESSRATILQKMQSVFNRPLGTAQRRDNAFLPLFRRGDRRTHRDAVGDRLEQNRDQQHAEEGEFGGEGVARREGQQDRRESERK